MKSWYQWNFFHLEKIKCTFFQITEYETTPYKAKKKKKKKEIGSEKKEEKIYNVKPLIN